jgi:hypothetical protein
MWRHIREESKEDWMRGGDAVVAELEAMDD